jgi:hypothetical protein
MTIFVTMLNFKKAFYSQINYDQSGELKAQYVSKLLMVAKLLSKDLAYITLETR